MNKLVFFLTLAIVPLGLMNVANASETRIRIAIIDSGVDLKQAKEYMCKTGNYDFTGYGLQDVYGHGTNIAGIFAKRINPKTHCLMIVKFFHTTATGIESALEYIQQFKPKYVNLSLTGRFPSAIEEHAIHSLLNSGAVIAVAAGNEGQNLDQNCNSYPACYNIQDPKYIVVGSRGAMSSNYGGPVTAIDNGTSVEGFGIVLDGTSQATANYLSKRIQ